MIQNNKKYISLVLVLLIFIFLLGQLGNLNAIRQGTEGFYLQISNEMYASKNYLTPTYFGENHWSKPPLQFWFAQLFYKLFNSNQLVFARLSILVFSFGSFLLIVQWLYKHLKISRLQTLCFLMASIGLLKYSRIFMMELPLTLLTTLSVIYFYSYSESEKTYELILASCFLGFSVLIKGPVSFVMATGGVFLYLLYLRIIYKKNLIGKFIIYCLLGLFIGSIWFYLSYLAHGNEFIEYFFIRENLGKFSSKSYPVRHVFQGLMLYALPWSFYLFMFFSKTIRGNIKKSFSKHNTSSKVYCFILSNFIFFFTLWLIPSQRSHHYAIPSLPFFLIGINLLLLSKENIQTEAYKRVNKVLSCFFIILILALLLPFFFDEFLQDIKTVTYLILTIISLSASVYFFIKNKKQIYLFTSTFLSISLIWIYITPLFVYPVIPNHIIKFLENKKVMASVRKPYFLEQALNRKINVASFHIINKYSLKNPKDYIIINAETYERFNMKSYTRIIHRWPTWKHGRKAKDILNAMKRGELASLKTEIFLVYRRSENTLL